MANELITHYETYKETHKENAYTLEKCKDTSRVLFLKHYLTKYLQPGSKVLDIGCGDMYLSKLLPQFNWVGLDIAPNMSNDKAIKHDLMAEPYPFKDQEFDGVVCSEVLEHLWDPRVVHRQARRVIKPDGVYIISTPNHDHIDHLLSGYKEILFDDKYSHFFEHIRQYNLEVHNKFLARAGFKYESHVGCDAHFTKFFTRARGVLAAYLDHMAGQPVSPVQTDQILGQMFPENSHTILIVSRPV